MFASHTRRRLAGIALVCATAALAFPAFAEPALWKAQGPNGAVVYLLGTVHVLKPDVQWRSAKIDAAFKASGSLWEEIKDTDDPAAMQPLVLKYGVDPGHPLTSKLDAEGKAKLEATAAAYGMKVAQVEPMRPWLAGLTFTVLPLLKAGYDLKSGVDVKLKAEAAAAGKPLNAFETTEQQIKFFADLPQDQEVAFLLSTLDEVNKGSSLLDELVADWAAGDVAGIERLMTDDMREKYHDLYQTLLVNRNQAMAVKIKALLDGKDTVFVAVGAAHLAGPDGIPADLTKMGVTVVRQ